MIKRLERRQRRASRYRAPERPAGTTVNRLNTPVDNTIEPTSKIKQIHTLILSVPNLLISYKISDFDSHKDFK